MTAAPSSLALRQLRLRRFRNLAELELAFPPEGVAIIGPNGSGKTNLIEAIYYLEIFRSFRGASDRQLVRFGADAFHVRGRFSQPEVASRFGAKDAAAGEELELAVGYERSGREKRVTVDGLEPERLGDAIGRVGAVVFSPSDVEIIAGPPGARRRFLDIVLSVSEPGYLPAVRRYRHVRKQRNQLLKEDAGPEALAAWDAGLVERGARVMRERAAWLAARADGFAERYAAIGGTGAEIRARMRYRPSVPLEEDTVPTSEEAADAFRTALERTAERERERGVTLVGPHRDDVGFMLERDGDGMDLREFGSGGQQRTAAVALRLCEADTVRAARGRPPIVLLDDVFAELDPGRARALLELLESAERGQIVLTAPKPSDLEPRRGTLPRWRIAGGEVST